MPWLIHLIPDADVLCALEPAELGLRMLPALASWQAHNEVSLGAFLLHAVGDGRAQSQPGQYPLQQRSNVDLAIREAWAWLEGSGLLIENPRYVAPNAIRMLSRRARQIATERDARKVFASRQIPKETLHVAIREDVWALYHRGKFDTAVFEAMKAVEVAVRDAAGLTARDIGVPLMRKAFDAKSGPLADMGANEAEREARAHLFVGAIGSYKNPHSHRNVLLDDPDEAAEIIMLANHLLRIVDSRRGTAETQ